MRGGLMMRSEVEEFIDDVLSPNAEFTPIPFWFLNDQLDLTELKAQLQDFKEKGVDAVVLHPRIGIPKELEFLSEEYFRILRFIVETAASLQMKIVLYDEGMYPSGSAKGQVVASNPDFASLGLTLTTDSTEGLIIAVLENGKYLVEKKSGGTIRGIHFGEDDGEPNAPLAADILNAAAVDKFIELIHEQHYHYLKEYFGTVIIGFFTDEPCPLGRNTRDFFEWTKGLELEIKREGGELAELEGLFEKRKNKTTEIYERLIRSKLNDNYYKKLFDWCERHQIMLMGHPAESDDIEEETYFHIPGQDLIFRRLSPEAGGVQGRDSVQAKCSADAARFLGRRRNSNECFGVCSREGVPWYFTGADMKWYIDWLGVRGVNLFIPHAFYYSLKGIRKDERPPDVGPNNIWWPYYGQFSDYMKRISYLMTDSQNVAEIGVLCESRKMPDNELIPFYEHQIEFNYLPKSYLENHKTLELPLNIGNNQYNYLINRQESELEAQVEELVQTVKRDFCTEETCSGLRVTHLLKSGYHIYFVFNEVKDKVITKVTVPVKGVPIFLDLWAGKYNLVPATPLATGTEFCLKLGGYETVAILFEEETAEASEISLEKSRTFIGNLDTIFKLTDHDQQNNRKTYTATYDAHLIKGDEVFEVTGEEMAECFCNGVFAGVSFFGNHQFTIGPILKEGTNELKIVMTGNIANKYSESHIPYGMGQF